MLHRGVAPPLSRATKPLLAPVCAPKVSRPRPIICRTQSPDVDGMVLMHHTNFGPVNFSVHGRHVTVDEKLRDAIIDRLVPVLEKMSTSEYVEGAGGGISHVDVRLMNTAAEIHVNPMHVDKSSHALHDTFVRMGELRAEAVHGGSAWECFESAVEQLEHKLKPQTKSAPRKVNYRNFSNSDRSNSTGAGGRP